GPRSGRRADRGRTALDAAGAMTLIEALARVLVGLAGSTAAGWAVSRPVVAAQTPREHGDGLTRRERFAWALAAGLVLPAVGLIALLAFGIRPTGVELLLFEALAGGIALAISSRADAAVAPARSPGREPTQAPV